MAQTKGKQHITAVKKLRNMLSDPAKTIVCPGVYDGFTARIALQEGAECLYMTGAGTSMSRLGMADMGLVTLNDMLDNASMIANIDPSIPLIADADTGYGGAIMVGRTVQSYIRAGVAALHLEDQVVTKRCGHLKNKQLVDIDEYTSRFRAAAMAREQSHGDIVLIARTDALQSFGYDEAVTRLKAAIAEGADVAFLEGVTSKAEAERCCKALAPTPCLFNNVPGGVSPDLSVEEAKQAGYRILIYPGLALEGVYLAVRKATRELLGKGKVDHPEDLKVKDLFDVCGLRELIAFDVKAGSTLWKDGA